MPSCYILFLFFILHILICSFFKEFFYYIIFFDIISFNHPNFKIFFNALAPKFFSLTLFLYFYNAHRLHMFQLIFFNNFLHFFSTFYYNLSFFKKKLKLAVVSYSVIGFTLGKYLLNWRLFMVNQ